MNTIVGHPAIAAERKGGKAEVARFAIIALPRSGSNYFISRLLPSPGLLIAWEPFNKKLQGWFDKTDLFRKQLPITQKKLTDVKLRDADPSRFYDQAFSSKAGIELKSVRALGFKIFSGHNPAVCCRVLRDFGLRILLLERRNRLASYSSELLARQTNKWISTATGNGGGYTTKFDAAHFEMYLENADFLLEMVYDSCKEMGRPHQVFWYEDFIKSDNDIESCCSFLGIDYRPGVSSLLRQNTPDILERFTNRRQAESFLSKHYPQYLQ